MDEKNIKAGPGRPTIKEARSEKISVSLTKAEKAKLLKAARERSETPPSSYAQFLVVQGLNEEKRVDQKLKEIDARLSSMEKSLSGPFEYILERLEELNRDIQGIVKANESLYSSLADLKKMPFATHGNQTFSLNCMVGLHNQMARIMGGPDVDLAKLSEQAAKGPYKSNTKK
jgi:hypothetical protein